MPKDKKDDKKKKGDKGDKKDKKADKGDKKDKKADKKEDKGEKEHKNETPATDNHDTSGNNASPELSNIFAKFDHGHKGYLDKNEVAKLVQEMQHSHPRVGPFANGHLGTFPYSGLGLGSSIYGNPSRNTFGLLGNPNSSSSSASSSTFGSNFLNRTTLPPVSSAGTLLPPPPPSSSGTAPDANSIALAQAYQTRLAALSTVMASLLAKRETLSVQLAKVQARAAEVASTREAIEAETLADTEAILHRLRAVEGAKQSILQRDADVLVGDISAIDRFYAALTSYQPAAITTDNSGTMTGTSIASTTNTLYDPALALEFMRGYAELCAEADRLTGKAIKTELDIQANDFERETASRIDLSSKYQALVDLVAAKDRIILQMLKERESVFNERETARQAVERATVEREEAVRDKENDVTHLTKLVDALTSQLVDVTEKLANAPSIGVPVPMMGYDNSIMNNTSMYNNGPGALPLQPLPYSTNGNSLVRHGSGGRRIETMMMQQQQQQNNNNNNNNNSAFLPRRSIDGGNNTTNSTNPSLRSSTSNSGTTLSIPVPLTAVRPDESVAFSGYLQRPRLPPSSSSSATNSTIVSTGNGNPVTLTNPSSSSSVGALLPVTLTESNGRNQSIVPMQGLYQPSPLPVMEGGGNSTTTVPSSSSNNPPSLGPSVPPSPRWATNNSNSTSGVLPPSNEISTASIVPTTTTNNIDSNSGNNNGISTVPTIIPPVENIVEPLPINANPTA